MATNEINVQFEHARKLQAAGRHGDAEQVFRQLAARPGEHREAALAALSDLYLESRRPNEAIETLTTLTRELPDKFYYLAWLATLLDQWGHTGAAVDHYLRYLERQPQDAKAHFNLALLYKRQRRFDEALKSYESAIELGINDPEEVYSNMGLVYSEMRDAARAEKMFRRSLEIDEKYIPALFNLAGLHEELGHREDAVGLYRSILEIDPSHHESLARIAYSKRHSDVDDPVITELRAALDQPQRDPIVHESLYFALGKALDDCGDFDAAMQAYDAANALGQKRNPPYNRSATSQIFKQLAEIFDADWIRRVETDSDHAPVFICGMFRSGSTLAEQFLAGHPDIVAGGELDVLPWLISKRLSPYPGRAADTNSAEIAELAREYVDKVGEIVPNGKIVTDKRPDNFLHLGLIRAAFPNARIVYTRRNALDNCLSVYFQQLGEYLAYGSDIEATAHYYVEHQKLMQHWQSCFGDNMFTLDYDELVRSPQPVVTELLGFLGLGWDDNCLRIEAAGTMVKTASVWQVREPLHQSSSGRRHNYPSLVERVQNLLPLETG